MLANIGNKTYLKKIFARFTALIVMISLSVRVNGQGCSDAGICTISSFKPQENADLSEQYKHQIKIGMSYGQADHNIAVIGNYLEYGWQMNDKSSLDFKLTSISQSGNGISVFGISDLFLSSSYIISSKSKITTGVKMPFGSANRTYEALPLPMDYQSSLGTVDLILGFSYQIAKIQLALGLQQPLFQNENEFLVGSYPLNSELKDFTSTNQFKRSGDVLLRVSYPLLLSSKFKLTPSFLPIYHLANDKYTDNSGIQREIDGSNGLTLNANVYLDYNITSKSALQLNFGAPLVVREVRPDGLTRSFIGTLEYRFRF